MVSCCILGCPSRTERKTPNITFFTSLEMNSSQRYYILLFITLMVYFGVSKYVFDQVYDTIQIVIDELYHIPQGQAYCHLNFTHWDPKITTLPGLYLVSAAALIFYIPCDTYNLRFINLIASCFNLILFSSILRFVYFLETKQSKNVIQALSLTLLPPLYFFSHVYYTDTLSLTFLLAYTRLCFNGQHKFLMLLFGMMSILMRQTNVAWVAMVFGHKALDLLVKSSRVIGKSYFEERGRNLEQKGNKGSLKFKRYYDLLDVIYAVKYHISTHLVILFKFLTLQDWLVLLVHVTLLSWFAVFAIMNGSIVLGDKGAHEATLHLPQLLYFLIFYGVFGLPYVLAKMPSTLGLLYGNKFKALMFGFLMLIVVHLNEVVHPYLLADNRHFTFYIWNRWYGKYDHAIYMTVPVYVFLLFSVYDNIKDQNCASFLLPYCISLFSTLGLQKLIEVRYFLIPYIILRLRMVRPPMFLVLFEFLYYLCINAAAFHVFFNKEVFWKDFDYAQRIIW